MCIYSLWGLGNCLLRVANVAKVANGEYTPQEGECFDVGMTLYASIYTLCVLVGFCISMDATFHIFLLHRFRKFRVWNATKLTN